LRVVRFLFASSIVCVASSARGEEKRVLRVERAAGAETCPDPASFEARVREGLASEQKEPSARTVVVRFERKRAGHSAAVRTSDGTLRTLVDDGASCAALADATALAVRLALDLEPAADAALDERRPAAEDAALRGEPSSPVAEQAAPTAEPSSPVAERAARQPRAGEANRDAARDEPPSRRSSVGLWLLGGAGAAAGLIHPFSTGARAGAGVTLDSSRWTIGATGSISAARTFAVGSGEVDLAYAGAGLEACRRHGMSERVTVGACGRLELGRLSGTARGFDRSEAHARPLATASLLARAQLRLLGPAWLFAELGVAATMVRERFQIDGVGLVHDPALAAPIAALGAVVEIE
jgi:hypothetical protein